MIFERVLSASDCSDDGDDNSDHDLTPCNPSPSLPGFWASATGGGGGGGGRHIDDDDVEENWLCHVDKVTNEPTNYGLLSAFGAFSKLFEELKVKTCVITQDAAAELSKDRTSIGQDLVKLATDQLQVLTDILSDDYCFPHVW